MKLQTFKWLTLSLSGVFLLGLPAFAQQGPRQPQQSTPNQQMQQQKQQTDRQQQAAQGQSQQQQMLIAFGLEPITRVAVSYDFDDDGQVDAIDYINPNLPPVFFLDQQSAGQQGSQQAQRQQQTGQRSQQMAQQKPGSGQKLQGAYKMQGTIQDLRTTKLSGSDEQRVFALVKTQKDKNVAVDLGPQWKVNQLNLKKGDQISAIGRISRVDQKPVLQAFSVRSGEQRISIPGAQAQMAQTEKNADRYNVTLLNTRTVNIPGGPSVVMSKVRLEDGSTTLVNLGPSNELNSLNLQANQDIRILARPTRIAGQKALIAERVAVGQQQVDIDWNQIRAGQAQG